VDMWDFKKWRRQLKYSQIKAAKVLGLRRAAIQHWESERVAISHVVELACEELTRRWKQRSDFGPVTLMYSRESLWPTKDQSSRRLFVECELCANNDDALQRADWLSKSQTFINPIILARDGEVVWAGPDLLTECARRKEKAAAASAEPADDLHDDTGPAESV
jgi:DNA-binding XRE family transcriptional regulator